jgi:hypothetical protein
VNRALLKPLLRFSLLFGSLAITSLFLIGCPMVDWKELNYTRRKPLEIDLVGRWKPTAQARKEILGRGKYPAADYAVSLNADGTFAMHNMPDWWLDSFGLSQGRFHDGAGTWKLEERKEVWRVWGLMLQFDSFSGNRLVRSHDSMVPLKAPWKTWVNLYRQSTPYLIFFRIGDPNEGDVMFFERAASL